MATAVAEEQSTTVQALGLVRSHLVSIAEQFGTGAGPASTAGLATALGAVEHVARLVEYLQVVGAAAADQQEIARVGETRRGLDRCGPPAVPGDSHEFRDTAEYLRARLGITRLEAQRRIRLGKWVLSRQSVTGETCPAMLEAVGGAFRAGVISSYTATRISDAVERVRPVASGVQLQAMEEGLAAQATESDADLVNVVIRRWEAALDPDGAEPSEGLLKAQQGVFLRGRRRGLHRLEVAADDEQFEYLLTVMNIATNPRTAGERGGPGGLDPRGEARAGGPDDPGGAACAGDRRESVPGASGPGGAVPGCGTPGDTAPDDSVPDWERRTRAQRHLDGLVGACQVALATDTLPATGGHRPQVMVTIDYRALVEELHDGGVLRRIAHGWSGRAADSRDDGQDGRSRQGGRWAHANPWQDGQDDQSKRHAGTDGFIDPSGVSRPHPGGGYSVFGGPVTAHTVRKIACDADIIPIVLGGHGEIFDVGRARRLFGVAQRRALVARDRGCAFPGCTVPAVWSEAHHITPWAVGGTTDVSNGCLLCSFHHRLIERGNWTIQTKHGIPWFTPPPYLDPDRTPRRNRHRELTLGATS
ncbi:hypothetical protein IWX63_003007 [Arthrobacter sp. CAN_A2]|uniref:HNH endonuclease signature motif containing protein n=1 Tax=Arthrobacter sp. CAN_A2 TaxID=2787718 RepID=UPI001A1D56B3